MSSLTPPSSPTLDAARATLGIPSFASRDESRRAYRALARLFHPDKGGDVTKFRKVQKAHEIIEGWFKQQGLIKSRGTVSSKDDNDVASQNEKGETKHENQNDDSNPLAPTQDLEKAAFDALHAKEFQRAILLFDAVISRALGDEIDGRDDSTDTRKNKKSIADFYFTRAKARAGTMDWSETLKDCDCAIARRGLWLEPLGVRAVALEKLGRHAEAQTCYSKVLANACERESDSDGDSDGSEETSSNDNDEGMSSYPSDTDSVDSDTVDSYHSNTADVIANLISSAEHGFNRCRDAVNGASKVCEFLGSKKAAIVAVAFAPLFDSDNMGKQSDSFHKQSEHSKQHLLAAGDSLGCVQVWCVPSGEFVASFQASRSLDQRNIYENSITSLVWGPSCVAGEGGYPTLRLAATTDGGDATLWQFQVDEGTITCVKEHRVVTGAVAEDMEIKPKTPCVCSFDASSTLLAVGDFSGRLRVFDAQTGKLRRASRRVHNGPITCVDMHPMGWQCATGSTDGDGRCWDLEGMSGVKPGGCQHTLRWASGVVNSQHVTDCQYAPCGRLVVLAVNDHMGNAGAGSYRLLTWSVVTGRLCTWHDAHKAPVTSLAWERNGGDFLDKNDDETKQASLNRIARDKKRLKENVVVTACEDGALRVWSLRGAPQGLGKPAHECWEYAENSDDMIQVSGVTDIQQSTLGTIGAPPIASGAALSVSRSPGGGHVATAHVDGTIRVLDSRNFETKCKWSLGSTQTTCDWAPSGVELENADTEVSVRDFDEVRMDKQSEDDDDATSDERTTKKLYNLLATAGVDGTICVWRVDVSGDFSTWRDPDEGVVAAIGPGLGGASKALPASLLTGVSTERVSKALETFGGENSSRKGGSVPFSVFTHKTGPQLLENGDTSDTGTHNHRSFGDLDLSDVAGLPSDALAFALGPDASKEAALKLKKWQAQYDLAEVATNAAAEERRRIVRDLFPAMMSAEKRAANVSHSKKMKPLREERTRLWGLMKTGGFGEEGKEDGKENETCVEENKEV